MPIDWVAAPILQWQHRNFVLREVIFGQLHRTVEDRDDVLGLELFRLRVRPMALKANAVRFLGPQKMLVVSTVRFVTNRTSLPEGGLVQVHFFELIRLIRVASEACVHWIRL